MKTNFINRFKEIFKTRLQFPKTTNHIDFAIAGQGFNYTTHNSAQIIQGGSESSNGLTVKITKRPGYYWEVKLCLYDMTRGIVRTIYDVKHLEELPPEIFNIVSIIIDACHQEYQEQPLRAEKEELAKKQELLNQLSGATALVSPNPLIRIASTRKRENET